MLLERLEDGGSDSGGGGGGGGGGGCCGDCSGELRRWLEAVMILVDGGDNKKR